MENRSEKLSQFFEMVKTITFWQRLFKWSNFRRLSYEAYEEFKAMLAELNRVNQELEKTKSDISIIRNDNEHLSNSQNALGNEVKVLREKVSESGKTITDLSASLSASEEAVRQGQSKLKSQEIEIATIKERINQFTQDNSQLKQQNTIFKQTEDDRKFKYENDVATLNSIREQIQADRNKEVAELQKKEIERFARMKETWANHQDNVKNVIKMICERHTIEYVEKVPFKGNPDNTIKVCDEYLIFDAKSPASSEDLNNFPQYIKLQTEAIKKYVKEENVKKDIFLVIPSNTVDVIERFSYNMADYNVFVVTVDALEPIILSLKRLEEYEFMEQLSPEERDNICRVIGKFAHLTKRRIQIDQFFGRQFLEILTKCESDLPHEILYKVVEYEKSEKLNPPMEKRAKQILSKELETDSSKINKEAEAKGIAFTPDIQQGIKSLPLYNDDPLE